MSIDPRISLQTRVPDVGAAINNALLNAQRFQSIGQSREQAPLRNQLLQSQATQAQAQAGQAQTQETTARRRERLIGTAQTALSLRDPLQRAIESGDITEVSGLLNTNIQNITQRQAAGENVDPQESIEGLQILQAQGPQALLNTANDAIGTASRLGLLQRPAGEVKGTEQRAFESKLSGLTEEQKLEATLIDLGLSSRAVGTGAATIAKEDLTDLVADSQAVIKQRGKFAEMTGSSRAKTIDKGFERINGINKNIRNLDKAVDALDRGAGTGAAERFFPSIKAATRELNQIQNELALDVIGAVTFGALSEGELKLAKETALDTGLSEEDLRRVLGEKKNAQVKLRDYFQQQIDHLDQGGTVASFLRQQERGSQTPQTPQAAPQEGGQQVLRFDAQGNLIQ